MYNVIVPLIGSPDAEEVLGIARTLSATDQGAVDLIHVIRAEPNEHGSWAARHAAAAAYLATIARTFPEGAMVRPHVRSGDPVECISDLARTSDSNVLVISPRWSEDRQGFAPESASRKLIETLQIPTIMVPIGQHDSVQRLETVLLSISCDRETNAIGAVNWLSPLAPFFRLVSIVPANGHSTGYTGPPATFLQRELNEPDIADYQAVLLQLSRSLTRKGIRNNWEVRYGSAVHEILRAAETTETDLIVFTLSYADEGALSRIGTDALTIARHSRIPVLIFPSNVGAGPLTISSRHGSAEM